MLIPLCTVFSFQKPLFRATEVKTFYGLINMLIPLFVCLSALPVISFYAVANSFSLIYFCALKTKTRLFIKSASHIETKEIYKCTYPAPPVEVYTFSKFSKACLLFMFS